MELNAGAALNDLCFDGRENGDEGVVWFLGLRVSPVDRDEADDYSEENRFHGAAGVLTVVAPKSQ